MFWAGLLWVWNSSAKHPDLEDVDPFSSVRLLWISRCCSPPRFCCKSELDFVGGLVLVLVVELEFERHGVAFVDKLLVTSGLVQMFVGLLLDILVELHVVLESSFCFGDCGLVRDSHDLFKLFARDIPVEDFGFEVKLKVDVNFVRVGSCGLSLGPLHPV